MNASINAPRTHSMKQVICDASHLNKPRIDAAQHVGGLSHAVLITSNQARSIARNRRRQRAPELDNALYTGSGQHRQVWMWGTAVCDILVSLQCPHHLDEHGALNCICCKEKNWRSEEQMAQAQAPDCILEDCTIQPHCSSVCSRLSAI